MPDLTAWWSFARLRRITTSSHRYIAEIDGLRFIAIFSVLLFHVYYAATHVPGVSLQPSSADLLLWPIIYGHRGVDLFFVISGFILGLPFAAQYLTAGPPVKVGRFYLRRVTRLEPPYVLALLFFYGAALVLRMPESGEPGFLTGLLQRLGYAFVIIHGVPPSLNGVTWTLEIEVQFYLLAPLLTQIYRAPAWPRRLAMIAVICASPIVASAIPWSHRCLLGFLEYFFTGLLLADIYSTRKAADRKPSRIFDLIGLGCLVATALLPGVPLLKHFLPWILAGVFWSALRGPWFNAILRRPAIAVLGGMCYSLYLLHYPLISFVAKHVVSSGISVPMACLRLGTLALPAALAAGIIFYIFIERPCMNPNWPAAARDNICRLMADFFGKTREAEKRRS